MKKIVLFFGIFSIGIFSNAQSSLPKNISDSLWNVWINPNLPDTTRLIAINKFIREGYLNTKQDSAFYYAQLQYDFALKKGIKKYMGHACNTQGAALYLKLDFLNALNYYSNGLLIFQELNDLNGIALALNGMGNIYKDQNDFAKAYDYYTQALKLFEQAENKSGMTIALHNIGINYKNQGEYELAIQSYEKSLKISEELGDRKGKASTLGSIGIIYKIQGDYVKALDYYNKCLAVELEFGNKRGAAGT